MYRGLCKFGRGNLPDLPTFFYHKIRLLSFLAQLPTKMHDFPPKKLSLFLPFYPLFSKMHLILGVLELENLVFCCSPQDAFFSYLKNSLFTPLLRPTDIAAALRQELDGCERLRVGWEAVADSTLLALLHRDAAKGCQWDALAPHLTGRHVYMATPPQGHPRPAWDDLIAAFHDHEILPNDTWREVQRKTLGRDYRCRVRARLLEIRDSLRQSWEDLWLRHLDPWSPPSHLPHTCRLCGECDTVSFAASTGANRCARCAQVAACPWPEPPTGSRRRTEEEALHRRIEGARAPSHERAGPAGAALLWIHVHLRDPTSVAHLSHVFAP